MKLLRQNGGGTGGEPELQEMKELLESEGKKAWNQADYGPNHESLWIITLVDE